MISQFGEADPGDILEESSEEGFGDGTTFLSTNMEKLMQQPGKWYLLWVLLLHRKLQR